MTDIAHETQPKTNTNDQITHNTSKLTKNQIEIRVRDCRTALYRNGTISLGKAGEILRLSKQEILHLLSIRGIPINYTTDDLKSDLETLDPVLG